MVAFNGKQTRVSRLVFYLVNGRWPSPEARHVCDNPPCFNPTHIIEGTHRQNEQDKWDRGRGQSGERIGTSKLTQQQVREIRKEYATGNVSQQAIADRLGVVQSTIGVIVRGVRWKQIE
jgi:predicted XRE-type DNA-binding protein